MAFWASLAILFIAVIAGLAFASLRGWQLFKDARRFRRTAGPELDRINATTLLIEHHLAQADAAALRLTEASNRLAVSRERLQIQLAALGEARMQVRRVFWFVPGL